MPGSSILHALWTVRSSNAKTIGNTGIQVHMIPLIVGEDMDLLNHLKATGCKNRLRQLRATLTSIAVLCCNLLCSPSWRSYMQLLPSKHPHRKKLVRHIRPSLYESFEHPCNQGRWTMACKPGQYKDIRMLKMENYYSIINRAYPTP